MDREAALSALRSRSQFNVIDPGRGWKADFIFPKNRPFSREEFRRRVTGDSELQRQDIRGREYIEKWVDDIGAREEWKGFMEELHPG